MYLFFSYLTEVGFDIVSGNELIMSYLYSHIPIVLLQIEADSWLSSDPVILLLICVLLVSAFLVMALLKINSLKRNYNDLLAANQRLNSLNNRMLRKNSQVNKENSKLEELNNVKDRLFSIISHDVRGPVKSVQGMLNLLQSDAISKDELKHMVMKLSMNISNISTFLENLLSWADNQMSNSEPKIVEIDVKELLVHNIELLSFRAEQKNIQIKNSLKQSILCQGDEDMINLVVRNLLTNAIKFTPQGGEIELGAYLKNGDAIIFVEDNGVGIGDRTLDQLFDLKYVTTNGTMNERGTGLGLTLCKDFIEKNGGEIGVESELGQGSKFYFSLPLAREMMLA